MKKANIPALYTTTGFREAVAYLLLNGTCPIWMYSTKSIIFPKSKIFDARNSSCSLKEDLWIEGE